MYNVHVGFLFSCLKFFMFFYFYRTLEPMFKQQLFYNRIHISDRKKKKDTDVWKQGLWSFTNLQSRHYIKTLHFSMNNDKIMNKVSARNIFFIKKKNSNLYSVFKIATLINLSASSNGIIISPIIFCL